MWSKAMIGSFVGAALLGADGLAVAAANGTSQAPGSSPQATSSATASARPTSSTPDKKKGHAKKADPATNRKKVQHGEWVTQDKAGAFVTREAIRGQVSAVSATSITVQAKDGVSLTFAVAADTKVRVRANGAGASKKAAAAKITDVKTGQQVMVAGTGKGSLVASHIMVTSN